MNVLDPDAPACVNVVHFGIAAVKAFQAFSTCAASPAASCSTRKGPVSPTLRSA